MTLFSIRAVVALAGLSLITFLPAQEIVVDDTGRAKHIEDDPETPMEQFLEDGKYTVGDVTFAKPAPSRKKSWTLIDLDPEINFKINKALIAAMEGKKESLAKLISYKEKATPHLWTLMARSEDRQKFIASAAAKLPSANGDSLAFRMLLNLQKEVRDPAWIRFKTISRNAQLGVWVHSKDRDVRKVIGDQFNLKEKKKNRYLSMRDALYSKKIRERFKEGLDRKNPDWVCDLFIDHLLNLETIKWKSETDFNDALNWLKRCNATAPYEELGVIRLNPKKKVGVGLSRHKDWYIRSAFCRALRQRKDLAWEPVVIEALLERLRDLNLHVREEALTTLRTYHPIDILFGRDRHLVADSEVIRRWTHWWPVLKPHAEQFADMIKKNETLKITKLKANTNIYNGDSPKAFQLYKVSDSKLDMNLYFVDVNRDGRLSFLTDRYIAGKRGKVNLYKQASLPLSRIINVKSKLYYIDFDLDDRELRATPVKSKYAPICKVKFSPHYNPKHDAHGVAVSNAPDINLPVSVNKDPTVLLQGEHQLVSGWIRHDKNKIKAEIRETHRTSMFPVDKSTKTVDYGSDLELNLEWQYNEADNTVTLQPVEITGMAGEAYRKIDPKLETIEISIVTGDLTSAQTDWESTKKILTSAIMGGLTPPLDKGMVDGLMAGVPSYEQLELTIPGLQIQLDSKKTSRDSKQADLDAELAKPVEEQDPNLIAQLQGEIAVLNGEIPTDEADLDAKKLERDRLKSQLEAGGGGAGLGLEDFIKKLKREPGARFMAQALSDIYWEPYTVDLNALPKNFKGKTLTIILRTEIKFGKIIERRIVINSKPKKLQPKN